MTAYVLLLKVLLMCWGKVFNIQLYFLITHTHTHTHTHAHMHTHTHTHTHFQILGWRENALHLLLLLTDNVYHSAGDGRVRRFSVYVTATHFSYYLDTSPLTQLLRHKQERGKSGWL